MKHAIVNLRRQWLVTLGSVLAIAMALLVPTALLLAGAGLGEVEAGAMETLEAEIILAPGVGADEASALASEVVGWEEVSAAQVKDGAANLTRLQREVSGLEGLDAAMMPTTILITLKNPTIGMGALAPRLTALETRPAVESIEAGSPEVAELTGLFGPMRWGLMVLAGLVALVGLVVVANALGLGVFKRREEIEILRHIGGADRHVVWPFYAESLWLGLLGGALGSAVVLVGLLTLSGPLGRAVPYLVFDPASVGLWAMPALLVAGVLMAWGGTLLSMRVYLRQVEGVAY